VHYTPVLEPIQGIHGFGGPRGDDFHGVSLPGSEVPWVSRVAWTWESYGDTTKHDRFGCQADTGLVVSGGIVARGLVERSTKFSDGQKFWWI
jgi:hypothetical protein